MPSSGSFRRGSRPSGDGFLCSDMAALKTAGTYVWQSISRMHNICEIVNTTGDSQLAGWDHKYLLEIRNLPSFSISMTFPRIVDSS